jgi:hypothetical protein
MVGSVTSKAEIRLKVNVSRDLTRMGIKNANGISLASFRSFHVRARSFALRSACLEERLQRRLHPCSGLHQSSFLLLCLGVPECFSGLQPSRHWYPQDHGRRQMPCAIPRCMRDGRLRVGRQQSSLMNPSPTRHGRFTRGAETCPVADMQKSHDARKGCSVIRSVGLGEHY